MAAPDTQVVGLLCATEHTSMALSAQRAFEDYAPVRERSIISTSHVVPPHLPHPTSHPGSAVEDSERQILNQILNLPTSSPPSTASTNRELVLNLATDFQAVPNVLVGTSGQSWCDLAWVPTSGRTEYVVNAVTTNLNDFGPTAGAPRRVIHHLQFLHHASALEWRDNLCRFRVFPLIVGRHYDISVFASVKGHQSAPRSATFSYETASGTNCKSIIPNHHFLSCPCQSPIKFS